MIAITDRLPMAWQNLRAVRGWRMQDMLNWHRMVKPLRELSSHREEYDLFQLVFELCTRFAVRYQPEPEPANGLWIHEATQNRMLKTAAGSPRVAHFVDAPGHLSGVATTLTQWSRQALRHRFHMSLYYAGLPGLIPGGTAFHPVGRLLMGDYRGLELPVPRVVEVLDYEERRTYDVVHISTPGPMGLLGLLYARRHGLPVAGTYHTDFPRYAAEFTGDPRAEQPAWDFMRWFYGQMDRVAAPTAATRDDLRAHGFAADTLRVVGRGVDTKAFHPGCRDKALRDSWGIETPHKLLYVGRVSKEKNLQCLCAAFRMLCATRGDTCLVVVGEGPYLEELRRELAGLPVVFTGRKEGKALSRIYASCDLFVFPSETDTFGVVLIEAQASGLPVVVSGKGGPRDCLVPGESGWIVDPMEPNRLADRLHNVLNDTARWPRLRAAARRYARTRTPEAAFLEYWNLHGDLAPCAGAVKERNYA
jgi:glycosyltransferase involved in cell wall biosynthesis